MSKILLLKQLVEFSIWFFMFKICLSVKVLCLNIAYAFWIWAAQKDDISRKILILVYFYYLANS